MDPVEGELRELEPDPEVDLVLLLELVLRVKDVVVAPDVMYCDVLEVVEVFGFDRVLVVFEELELPKKPDEVVWEVRQIPHDDPLF